jgi:hypothetical protein
MWHIYPVNDTEEHDLEGTMCHCNPTILWDLPEAVVIHNSFDCREIVEQAEQLNSVTEKT